MTWVMMLAELMVGVAVGLFGIAAGQVAMYSSKMDEHFVKAMQETDSASKTVKLERWKGFGFSYRMAILAAIFSGASLMTSIFDIIMLQEVVLAISVALAIASVPVIVGALVAAPK